MKKISLDEISKKIKIKDDLLYYYDEAADELLKSQRTNICFLEQLNVHARLRSEAKHLFEKYPNPADRPPLFGVLIGVKDLFVADNFETRGGSQLPAHLFVGKEASSVTKLKEAGAVVLGKTVSTEFAYSDPGPTKNPHNLAHTPGGSSSGSAAAVALGLVPVALGTQTIGSIIRPAAYCGVFGFKPSYNRIAKDGVIEFAGSVDHVGVFAQNLNDLQKTASILCDNWNENNSQNTKADLKFGIPAPGEYLDLANAEIHTHFSNVISKLELGNFQKEGINALADFADIKKKHWDICAYELWQVHKEWHKTYKDLYRELISALFEVGKNTPKEDVEKAIEGQEILRENLHREMDEAGIDFIIAPSTTDFAPKGLESTGNSIMNLPWTYAGLPAINIPFGKNSDNLPFGFQVIGRFNEDEQLFAFAKEIHDLIQK